MVHRSSLLMAVSTLALGSVALATTDTFYVSPSAAVGTYSGGSYSGGGAGTLLNPFGSIVEAYRAAYLDSNASVIQLEDGTYSTTHIGTYNGDTGVVQLGGDSYFGIGAPANSSPSITIQGNLTDATKVTISGAGATGALTGAANTVVPIFRAFNAYGTNLNINNVQIVTAGSASGRSDLLNLNFQSFPIDFNSDKITLGYTSGTDGMLYVEEGFPIPANEWLFNNTDIHLGSPAYSAVYAGSSVFGTKGPYDLLGWVHQDYNGGPGPSANVFNGDGNSRIYDSLDNLITNESTLALLEENGTNAFTNPPASNTYPLAYQDGLQYDQTTPTIGSPSDTNWFAQNFDLNPANGPTVPEPASLGLLAVSGLLLFVRPRR